MKNLFAAIFATFFSFMLWFTVVGRYVFALMYKMEYKGDKELTIDWAPFFWQFPLTTLMLVTSSYFVYKMNKERRERMIFMRREIAASVRRHKLEDQEREIKEKLAKRAEEQKEKEEQ